jgi:hypothetical protein
VANQIVYFTAIINGTPGDPQQLRWEFPQWTDGSLDQIIVSNHVLTGFVRLVEGDYFEIETDIGGNITVPRFKVVRISGYDIP